MLEKRPELIIIIIGLGNWELYSTQRNFCVQEYTSDLPNDAEGKPSERHR